MARIESKTIMLGIVVLSCHAAKAQVPSRPMPEETIDVAGTVVPCASDSDCPNASVCIPPPGGTGGDGTCYVPKGKYISIAPAEGNVGLMTARRLSVLTDEGPVVLGWIGEPTTDDIFGHSVGAMNAYVSSEPFYVDWSTLEAIHGTPTDVVHLGDCHVAPGYRYLVQAIEQGRDPGIEGNYSEALTLPTVDVFGDSAGPVAGGISSPPDCVANARDVMAALDYYYDAVTASWVRVDSWGLGSLVHDVPDRNITLKDVSETALGFSGFAYDGRDPCTCAGLPPCRPPGEQGTCSVPQYECGNGVLEPGEHCDDGGVMAGDGCDAKCQIEGLQGPTMRLVPVDATGPHTITGNTITLAGGMQSVFFEVHLGNWDPLPDVGVCPDQTLCSVSMQDCAVGTCEQADGLLKTYQARIAVSNHAGVLSIPVVSCQTSQDCREAFGTDGYPQCDTQTGFCDPSATIFVEGGRDDWVFAAAAGSTTWTDRFSPDPAFSGYSYLYTAPAVDDAYVGTFVLDVAHVGGCSIELDFVRHPDQALLLDSQSRTIAPITLIPAVIQVEGAPVQDCNANGIDDTCETAGGVGDCNFNSVPDTCESVACTSPGCADCNGNGMLDECDIASGASTDCNADAVPDDCQPDEDCNANGVRDICDIGAGTAVDCTGNLRPDACDIADGLNDDDNANGVPDVCEARLMPDGTNGLAGTVTTCTTDEDCRVSPGTQAYCIQPAIGSSDPGICYVAKNRYIGFEPLADDPIVAVRVSLDLGGGEPYVLGWAGPPLAVTVIGGYEGAGGPEPSPQWLSRITDAPHYRRWGRDDLGIEHLFKPIQIGDCEISTGQAYILQSVAVGLDPGDEANYTEPLVLRTTNDFGDIVGGSWRLPPDGLRNFKDISSAVRGFQSVQTEPKVWLDLQGGNASPEVPDFGDINFADITWAVAGFQGIGYPFAAPCDCPGQACP